MLKALASPWLTVAFFIVTALIAAVIPKYDIAASTMAVPFGLLIANLGAAILVTPRFRTDLPLLVFHLCLLIMVVLFTIGRLYYFEGRTLLNRGTTFDGTLQEVEHGPLHGDDYRKIRFAHLGLHERFLNEGRTRYTGAQVQTHDASGNPVFAEVSDDRPLIVDGYRITTSRFRGLFPVFRWTPSQGQESDTGVALTFLPGESFNNATAWQLPSGEEAWVMLNVDPAAARPDQGERVDFDAETLDHSLTLRIGEVRSVMKKGDSLRVNSGVLTYVRLDAWMGYRILYDPTRDWLLATVMAAVGSLLWFYASRVFSKPVREID